MKHNYNKNDVIKRHHKITRYCTNCGNVHYTYQSQMIHGKGEFCNKNCRYEGVSYYKKNNYKKIDNTCLNCGFKYKLWVKEYYCCEECRKEYILKHKKGIERLIIG